MCAVSTDEIQEIRKGLESVGDRRFIHNDKSSSKENVSHFVVYVGRRAVHECSTRQEPMY